MTDLLKLLTIAASLSLTSASAIEQAPAGSRGAPALALRCLSPEHLTCGCSLKIVTLSCGASHTSGWEAHFASELNDGAPLRLNLGGQVISLRSRRPITNRFSGRRGDRWTEQYDGDGMTVVIRYRPAKSTCPPEKEKEDGCEFFDVAADMIITRTDGGKTDGRAATYRALGSCGC